MKQLNKFLPWVLIAVLLVALLPAAVNRVQNENENKNVVPAVLYKDFNIVLSRDDTDKYMKDFKDAGVTTVALMEEDLNSLVLNGVVTNIKYNVLLHKYDEESMIIAEELRKFPKVVNDSYVIITKREESKELLAKWIPEKFTQDEYCHIQSGGNDVYCLYDGSPNTWEIVFGYDEKQFEYVKQNGFEIAMIFKIKNYKTDKYLDELDRLIKKYDIKYFNIKDDDRHPDNEQDAMMHIEGVSKLIKDNNMTLVVTEKTDQLSNQRPIGYNKIFADNFDSVVRAYETYDMQDDSTNYLFRYYQYLNSTIDRNLKFITITLIDAPQKSFPQQAELTVKATKKYIDKIRELGYKTDNIAVDYSDYRGNVLYTSAVSAAILILMMLLIIRMFIGKDLPKFSIACYIIALLSIAGTYVIPQSLVYLYPTACAALLPCFAITVMFAFVKNFKDRINTFNLTVSSIAVILAVLCAGALMLGAMLSGIDYYVNNLIFRGIKLSLFFPVVFSIFAYYFIFLRNENKTVLQEIVSVANAKISVYWLVIFGVFAAAGAIYIIRSGNVNEISGLESWMRTTITEIFAARPRTKEFLIGYPCLVLFVYYVKNTNVKVVSFITGVGSSILAASVTNTFCHVFTDLTTIYMRVVNGLVIGLLVCAAVSIANLVIVKLCKYLKKYA